MRDIASLSAAIITNLIYLVLFWVKATEYKEQNDIPNKYFAKDFLNKEVKVIN